MTEQIHGTVAAQLRRTRQRYTDGRQQLVATLLDAERPVTIPELVDLGVDQSQSSMYRNLAVLEQCGVVRRLASVGTVARYELAESFTGHHHHLVCHRCGGVEDLQLPSPVERALTAAADEVERRRDFVVDSHRFELLGTCGRCG